MSSLNRHDELAKVAFYNQTVFVVLVRNLLPALLSHKFHESTDMLLFWLALILYCERFAAKGLNLKSLRFYTYDFLCQFLAVILGSTVSLKGKDIGIATV